MADYELSKEELEAALEYCHDKAEEALQAGTREAMREALSEISDIGHPDSLLDVDVKNVSVEVTGWEGEEDDEESEREE